MVSSSDYDMGQGGWSFVLEPTASAAAVKMQIALARKSTISSIPHVSSPGIWPRLLHESSMRQRRFGGSAHESKLQHQGLMSGRGSTDRRLASLKERADQREADGYEENGLNNVGQREGAERRVCALLLRFNPKPIKRRKSRPRQPGRVP